MLALAADAPSSSKMTGSDSLTLLRLLAIDDEPIDRLDGALSLPRSRLLLPRQPACPGKKLVIGIFLRSGDIVSVSASAAKVMAIGVCCAAAGIACSAVCAVSIVLLGTAAGTTLEAIVAGEVAASGEGKDEAEREGASEVGIGIPEDFLVKTGLYC